MQQQLAAACLGRSEVSCSSQQHILWSGFHRSAHGKQEMLSLTIIADIY